MSLNVWLVSNVTLWELETCLYIDVAWVLVWGRNQASAVKVAWKQTTISVLPCACLLYSMA